MTSRAHSLIVATIDIGTAYSGYAFSFKHDYEKDPTRVSTVTWKGGPLCTVKQPTCLLCRPNGEFYSFGYEAEEQYADLSLDGLHNEWYFFRRFKMMLLNHKVERGFKIEDDKAQRMPAIKVFGMAIHYFTEHMQKTLRDIGVYCNAEDIDWVITVPAIWTDFAKQFMREAAIEAGIDDRFLTIVLESEAAAMYCQLLPKSNFDDTTYMVIDLGGGTADFTVLKNQSNGMTETICKTSGGAWGGIQVDMEFIRMIITIVGSKTFEAFFDQEKYDHIDLLREFELKKRSLRKDNREKVTIKLPVSLINLCEQFTGERMQYKIEQSPYAGRITLNGDKMRVDVDLLISLFNTSINSIKQHIKHLLQQPGVESTSTFLLVGGFSECQIVIENMRECVRHIRLIIPSDVNLAVMKGAVIMGHKFGVLHDVSRNLPYEILRMDKQSQNLYREALSAGTVKVYNIRLMIVGHLGVGKTALAQRLLNEEVKEDERESTEGIEVHSTRCEIDHKTREWRIRAEDELAANTQLIVEILKKHKGGTENQVKENSTSGSNEEFLYSEGKSAIEIRHDYVTPKRVGLTNEGSKISTNSSSLGIEQTKQKMLSSHTEVGNHDTNVNVLPELESKNSCSLIMKMNSSAKSYHTDFEEIQDIVTRAKSFTFHGSDVSYLSVLDFAGQFLFYTTHQAFMSWRTIYLLVTDISLSLTDAVEEDVSGVTVSRNKTRTVQEYISYWMNSIHSHVKNQVSGTESGGRRGYAPVILVATHMDKVSEEQAVNTKKLYFDAIRKNLCNSELIHHLADTDFAISNLGSDDNIEKLKQKIFDLAQKQSYWGEPIPARWLTLEKVLLERKREGIPV